MRDNFITTFAWFVSLIKEKSLNTWNTNNSCCTHITWYLTHLTYFKICIKIHPLHTSITSISTMAFHTLFRAFLTFSSLICKIWIYTLLTYCGIITFETIGSTIQTYIFGQIKIIIILTLSTYLMITTYHTMWQTPITCQHFYIDIKSNLTKCAFVILLITLDTIFIRARILHNTNILSRVK